MEATGLRGGHHLVHIPSTDGTDGGYNVTSFFCLLSNGQRGFLFHLLPIGTWAPLAGQEHQPCLQLLQPTEDRAVAVGLHGGHHDVHIPGTDSTDGGHMVRSLIDVPQLLTKFLCQLLPLGILLGMSLRNWSGHLAYHILASWLAASWLAASWLAASWLAASWLAASWLAASWLAASWLAASWLAASWLAASWVAASLVAASCVAASWVAASWVAASWLMSVAAFVALVSFQFILMVPSVSC